MLFVDYYYYYYYYYYYCFVFFVFFVFLIIIIISLQTMDAASGNLMEITVSDGEIVAQTSEFPSREPSA